MTVFVMRDGKLVDRATALTADVDRRSPLPSPRVSRMTPFESPVTGKEIFSHRERDKDMKAADAFDPRDLGPNHTFRRGREVQQQEAKSGRRHDNLWR